MDTSPLAGHAAGTSQHAAVHGRDNIVIQIQGDGNTVVPGLPHLTLTRYLTRRRQASTEIRLLNPYAMTIPLVGRRPELADLVHAVDAKPRQHHSNAVAQSNLRADVLDSWKHDQQLRHFLSGVQRR